MISEPKKMRLIFSNVHIKNSHNMTYQNFLKQKEPETSIFQLEMHITIHIQFCISHKSFQNEKKTSKLRPNLAMLFVSPKRKPKQTFHSTKNIVLNDDLLLQVDIPHNISDTVPPIQNIDSEPLGDYQ